MAPTRIGFSRPVGFALGLRNGWQLRLLRESILCFVSCGFRLLSGWCTSRAQNSKFCAQNFQCSFVYPYPSVSALAGGNSDHGPRKTRTKTQTTPDSVFIGERRNSDHGLSFWGGGNSDHGLSFGCFWGRGRRGGSQISICTVVIPSVPRGPFRTKNTTTIEKIVNYHAVVLFLRPPYLLRRRPFFYRKNLCNSRRMVSAHGAPR